MQWRHDTTLPSRGLWLLHAPRAAQTLRKFGLLRVRRERPRYCRTAEKCDDLATAAHSITSSASSIIDVGTVRPRDFAVFRLITSSNLVGCKTGRSAGFSPFRILPV